MRAYLILVPALSASLHLVACGEDEGRPRGRPIGRNDAGETGGRSGSGGRSGGGSAGDAGPGIPDGGEVPDGTTPGSGGASGTGGTPIDGSIVFPPIEGGPPADAGAPAPASCAPVRNDTVPADPCEAYAVAQCTHLEQCTPYALKTSLGDRQSCLVLYEDQCKRTYGGAGQATTLAQVHDCAERYVNAPCECVLGEACEELGARPGTAANGAACSDGRQCQGGVCQGATFTACGTCAAGATAGQVCGRNAPCAAGLVCNTDGVCASPRLRGQFCGTTRDCIDGLGCNGGKCGELLGEGEDCARDALACNTYEGVFCVGGKCVQYALNENTGDGDSARCGKLDPESPVQTLCSATAVCLTGHCQPRGEVGGQCDPNGRACATELQCDVLENRCVAVTVPSCGP